MTVNPLRAAPRVAVPAWLVLPLVAIYLVLLWRYAAPPPAPEVFGFSAAGKPLYEPPVHAPVVTRQPPPSSDPLAAIPKRRPESIKPPRLQSR